MPKELTKIVIDSERNDDWMKALPSYKDEIAIHEAIAKELADKRKKSVTIPIVVELMP